MLFCERLLQTKNTGSDSAVSCFPGAKKARGATRSRSTLADAGFEELVRCLQGRFDQERSNKKGAMMIARAAFIHQMEDRAACGRISNGFDLISNYTGASCYLVARYDHYSDRHHDFVLTSNWPFDLVRSLGAVLVDAQARTSEISRCLQAFEPSFQDVDVAAVSLPENLSPRVCLVPYNVGKVRLLMALLFEKDAFVSHDRIRDAALAASYHAAHFTEITTTSDSLSDLTDREIECLSWIGEGKTSDEIALIIGISRNTVNNYITSIMNKTGARTRSEAVAFAVRQRII